MRKRRRKVSVKWTSYINLRQNKTLICSSSYTPDSVHYAYILSQEGVEKAKWDNSPHHSWVDTAPFHSHIDGNIGSWTGSLREIVTKVGDFIGLNGLAVVTLELRLQILELIKCLFIPLRLLIATLDKCKSILSKNLKNKTKRSVLR